MGNVYRQLLFANRERTKTLNGSKEQHLHVNLMQTGNERAMAVNLPVHSLQVPFSMTAVDGYIQLLTFHAHFPSLIFTAPAITEMRSARESYTFSMREHRMHFVSGTHRNSENILNFKMEIRFHEIFDVKTRFILRRCCWKEMKKFNRK